MFLRNCKERKLDMSKAKNAAEKAWETIRRKKRTRHEAAVKAWRTRKANAKKRSDAAKKAWATRRSNMI